MCDPCDHPGFSIIRIFINAGNRICLPASSRIQTISWHPRLAVYHNFLSEEECDHIKKQAAPFVSLNVAYIDVVNVHNSGQLEMPLT